MQWFENEVFWQTFYPYMFGERRMAAAAAEVERVLALSGVASGPEQRRVLDLCCGPARHSMVLAQKGFEVTGVDRSPFLLSKARERTAGAGVELVEGDMRDFVPWCVRSRIKFVYVLRLFRYARGRPRGAAQCAR